MITLTEAAQEQIDNLCKDNNCYGVGLNLKGGGCAGFEYVWELVESAEDVEDRDEVINTGAGTPLIISSYSVMYLIGSTIDYKKDIMGSMFDIQNPNAQSACGCGVSVNFNDMF